MWVKSFRKLVLWDPGVAAGVTLQHLCKEPSCDGVSGVDRFGDVGWVSLPPAWEWVILLMALGGMGGPELCSKPGSACSPPSSSSVLLASQQHFLPLQRAHCVRQQQYFISRWFH